MRKFPVLHAAKAAVATIVTAGLAVIGPTVAMAQLVPTLALSAKPEADDSPSRGIEAVPAIAPMAALSQAVYPPKPSWKEERLVQAETLYLEGYKLYQAGDRVGARKHFDDALDLVLNARSEPVNRSSFDKRFDELVQKIYRIDVDTLQGEKPKESEPSYDKAPIDDILSLTFPVDPKLKPKVREEVGATVSQLPLEASDAVLSFINYFSGDRGRRTLIAGLRRAGRYKPMISRILDEEGIPQEFIFLAQAESGFLPRAISYMAAGGMWQFIRETGAKYGLKNDGWVDERFDPEMATRAAARHLRDLYHEFGDWYLAIAAYNCGQGNVDRAVAKTGYADVWELRSRGTLPLETSNYVPIILAMTIMAKNPQNYGIETVIPEDPLLYDTVDNASLTSLTLVSDIIGRPVSELKELNPALLRDFAPPGYRLHIPRGSGQTLMAGLEMVPAERRASWRAHRAETGESLALLATRYRTNVAALRAANNMAEEEINPGALLVIPAAPQPVVTARAARTPVRGAVRPGTRPGVRSAVASRQPARRPAASQAAAKAPQKQVRKPAATVARGAARRPQG
ncbi:MAG: transglycosylase SLT domain-containing protein [Acidobacteria bacterium]|nr:transglycosylase SLT domain-containing protein [Acidobacteriota bacterium]